MLTLSAMISLVMLQGLAPMALRIPNSWVRSLTVISMMLLTPTTPLSSVNSPTIHKAVVRMLRPFCICMFWRARFHIHSALSSSGAAL